MSWSFILVPAKGALLYFYWLGLANFDNGFYLIIYFVMYYLLEAFFFPLGRPKNSGCIWVRKWGGTGRSKRRGNCIHTLICEERIYV